MNGAFAWKRPSGPEPLVLWEVGMPATAARGLLLQGEESHAEARRGEGKRVFRVLVGR